MVRRMAGCVNGVERPATSVDRIAVAHVLVRDERFVDKCFARQAGWPCTAWLTRIAKGINRRICARFEGRDAV